MKQTKSSKLRRQEAAEGLMFISPWLVGFLAFTIIPVAASLYLSLCRWNLMDTAVWVGLDNYKKLMTGADPKFMKSLMVTTYYTLVSVPLNVVLSIAVALLLNAGIRGMSVFRTIYYLPSVTSGVAVAVLWMWIFNSDFGLLNSLLSRVGLEPLAWLNDEKLVIPSFIFMGLWGIGGNMVLYLAGLQSIPPALYEAAEIDGAGPVQKLFKVTLPLLSPVIFFNIIVAVIGSFQVFTQSFVMTKGGPNDASMFYVLYLFKNAFEYFKMGYACAMAWILFIVILSLTLLQFTLAKKWVYYESGEAK